MNAFIKENEMKQPATPTTGKRRQRQKARLLECEHFHVIFTLPSGLRPLWRVNRGEMTRLLFGAVRETLFELLCAAWVVCFRRGDGPGIP